MLEASHESRVDRLEAALVAERGVYEKAVLCDYGPYPPGPLSSTYAKQGSFTSDGERYSGRPQIYRFYRELVASHTLHLYTNCWVDPLSDDGWVSVFCYGFEAPTILGEAVVGLMKHVAQGRVSPSDVSWVAWKQEILLLAPMLAAWQGHAPISVQQSAIETGRKK